MAFEFLFVILLYSIPSFAQMILPLAFFLSVLLIYGRLYIENEMSILFSSGISKLKLAGYTLGIASIVLLANASISLWLAPTSEYQVKLTNQQQDQLTVFDFIQPGRFQGNGQKTTYISNFTPEEGWMNNIFMSDFMRKNGKDIPVQKLSDFAEQVRINQEGGINYLVFKNGTRYEGIPGQRDYRITTFDTYAIRLEEPKEGKITDLYTLPTSVLWGSNNLKEYAEMQWRLGIIMMIPILAIIGVSLSQVNPRQGRFFKMLPAILLMILYQGTLVWARAALEKGQTPMTFGLWWVHGIFAFIALILFIQFNGISWIRLSRKTQ